MVHTLRLEARHRASGVNLSTEPEDPKFYIFPVLEASSGDVMERAILGITVIVALVAVVGIFSSYDFGSADAIGGDALTGNVVASQQSCDSCSGYAPVCAKLNNRLVTYPNACEAACSGADVVAKYPCESIQKV